MAFADDLQSFLENRLLAYDPAIDLSENSPAQLQIIQPTIARFGEDPFSTDIPTFIRDRMVQEFPELAADNGALLGDILSSPLQLLLEPFKREVQAIRLNQSLNNAALMSDDEADALGANWFSTREAGDFASGTVRLFYSQPTTSRVSTDKLLSTSDGHAYFPIQNYFITAQQMLFNKQGSLYFQDIVVQAQNPGSDYNVAKGDINSIQDVPGVVKVANIADFTTGIPREDNVTFISRTQTELTEKSLVTKRGAVARTEDLFTSVRAMQIIGAGDPGMNRDILTGTGQGFLHLAGKATIYGEWLWVSEITYRDDGPTDSITPQPGDTIRFHPTTPAPPATAVVTGKVVTILSASSGLYLFLLDAAPYDDGAVHSGAFALLKPGAISISGVPGGIAADITVADDTVHLGGHTDVFIRPTQDQSVQTTLQDVTDDQPILAITDLTIPTANTNLVSSGADFVAAGVQVGDLLVIETGAGFAGTYLILDIPDANDLRVNAIFETSMLSPLRARVLRNIRIDLGSPKVPKLPFTSGPVSDLQTNVGSNEFRFSIINIQDYGAVLGDTINVVEGPDAGEFTIIAFGPVAGSVFVDRAATSTGANLSYQVYTKLTGITLPLIRIQGVEVLDSTGQTTGITVPYGDAVDIRPQTTFDGAGNEKTTYDDLLVAFPDMPEWASGGLPAAGISLGSINDTTDARYTLGLAVADGVVRTVTNDPSNQVQTTEINVPPFLWNGLRDKLIALVSETDTSFPNTIPGIHKTSDIANANIGDSITIHDGPNQGKYIITDLRILDLWGKADQGHRKVAIVQIDPPLPTDPIRTAISLINAVNVTPFWTAVQLYGFLQYAADWDNASGFYRNNFIPQLRTTLTSLGISYASDADLQAFFDPLIKYSYSVGPSAKGFFRTYFLEPVSVEFNFGTSPTTFTLASDGSKMFRLDPGMEPAQILPESLVATSPLLWNRNMGIRDPQDTYAFLTTGASFPARGIEVGDVVQFNRALNDLPSRGNMTSSWMCVTQAGSNVIQLILPPSDGTSPAGYGGVDNYTLLDAGQLLFIDSGPDIGAYTITKVITQDWVSTPPVLQVQLDQPMTHTTENFPVLLTAVAPPSQVDFHSALPAYVLSGAITFPATLNGKHLKMDYSIDGGVSYSSVEHTFAAADPYNSITDVVTDITSDATFTAQVKAVTYSGKLALVSAASGPLTRVRVNSSPSSPSAHSVLALTGGTTGAGVVGGATLVGTNRIYGSGLNQCQVNDWITLYAANSTSVLTGGTNLAGDDTAIIGTYQITAVGNDVASAPFWGTGSPTSPYVGTLGTYVEVSRTAPFPSDAYVAVRWIRHQAPSQTPTNTSDGGTEISDQFVRFRLYDAVTTQRTITDIPWVSASIHPLLSTSQQQVNLASPGIVDTGNGQRNFAHKAPYRVVRPFVYRASSTAMSTQREGALYFLDLPVIGYGPGVEMNVSASDGFILSGNRSLKGYTLEVADENFAYSDQEKVHIVLPNSVLPVGSNAELDNQFDLAGQNLQVTYNNAPLIEDIQAFFSSPLDRVTAANMLVRHFLPAYVILDATYSSGDTTAAVAADIISYINNIDPDTNEIRTDLIQDIIKKRGASTVTLPLTVISLFHGVDRRIRGMRSETSIGIGDTPFFKGTFPQTYFIAGSDTSKQSPRPNGEQIFLIRT